MKLFWAIVLSLLLVGMIVAVVVVTKAQVSEQREANDTMSTEFPNTGKSEETVQPEETTQSHIWLQKEGVLFVNESIVPGVSVMWYYDTGLYTDPFSGELEHWTFVLVPVAATLEQFGFEHTVIDETHISVFRPDDPDGKSYIVDLETQALYDGEEDLFDWISREPIDDWNPWQSCPYPEKYIKDGDLFVATNEIITAMWDMGIRCYCESSYEAGTCYFSLTD